MIRTIHIAVRQLVEYVLRCGDLRLEFMGSVRAVDGIRIHQQIQKQRPENYQAEVPVSYMLQNDRFQLSVNGRIDGVFSGNGQVIIEEIKSTRRKLDDLADNPDPVHWGQAECYAYMFAIQQGLSEITVQMTYVQADDGNIRELQRHYRIEHLADFFNGLLQKYMHWVAFLADWAGVRDRSLQQLTFPYAQYRPGQRSMAVAVYRTIRDGSQLLVQAATGIGKTMAALFPALKVLGEGSVPKVVFLTARTTGRLAAETALEELRHKGLRVKAVTLTAKEKICFNPQSACVPEECEYARGHYDRLNQALYAAFDTDAWNRTAIEQAARQHRVCPFEFSLELVNYADCVIGDYNYAFDPNVMLHRLFEEPGAVHAVLVDEAHNLVDRSREMFSAQLDKEPVLKLRRRLKEELPALYRSLGRINSWMAACRRRCREADGVITDEQLPEDLIIRLRSFLRSAERWLIHNIQTDFREDLLQFFFDAWRFIRIAEQYDTHYATLFENRKEDLRIKLYCLDPSHQLELAWQRCRAAVLFSATLTPADYFQKILGCSPQADRLNLPSPFPKQNLAVFLAHKISTLYRQRENSCRAVSRTIANLVLKRKGNYLLFFPSYQYMNMVHKQFGYDHEAVQTIVQVPDMTEAQREEFLANFRHTVAHTLVGFAVMGGIFGEGIDLKGERLTGAVIVGVGLPGICTERELIRSYYDRNGENGFEFAYQYPGINRVLQAAGRVIRSGQDRGVVLLIDQRYEQQRYRSLLPLHWDIQKVGGGETLAEALAGFWR